MHLRHILRRLFKLPLFTSIAVGTLALGIGANAAIFSVVQGVLLKPLPYPHPDELVALDHAAPGVKIASTGSAPFLYFTYREDGRVFQDVGTWRSNTMSVTGLAEPEEVPSLQVTDGVLPMLGVQPMVGRLFSKTDDAPGTPETVVLTAGYWRSKFGADPAVVGRTLVLDSRPREIIGVLPDSFRFLDRKPALLLPLRFDRSKTFLGNFSYSGLARLKPGVTVDQANAEVARLIPIAIQRFPTPAGYSAKMFEEARLAPRLRLLKTDLVGDVTTVLWVLMGSIGTVLLVACANVANLLLVRAEARQQELAVRAALGAGWGQIARELLLESLAIGIMGGIVGLGLAYGAVRLLMVLAPGNLPRLDDISIDAGVLLFTVAVSLLAGVLFGAMPILRYAGPHIGLMLRGGGRTASASRERRRVRNTLVAAQVALALVLLVSSGLMIRTFVALRQVRPGFTQPEQVQTLRISIPGSQVKDEVAVVRMQQAIADRIAALPGVTSVALSSSVTMTGDGSHDPVFAEDHVYVEGQLPPIRTYKRVSPGVIRTLGSSLVAGRDFTWADAYEKHPVVMVSENLARELWGEPSAAIGKRIRENLKAPWHEVVGVVADSRDDGVNQKAPTIVMWPMLIENFNGNAISVQRSMTYLIRSQRTGSDGFINEIGQAIWSINPNLPMASVRSLREIYDASLARTSFTLVMLAIAAGTALLLGVTGIYGAISYSVSQRTREIGIRMALGARRQEVTRMFVGHGLWLAGIGVACGVLASLAVTRLMASLLFEVSAADPVTYGAVSLSLVAAAVSASYIPALRAATVDPVDALRAE